MATLLQALRTADKAVNKKNPFLHKACSLEGKKEYNVKQEQGNKNVIGDMRKQ